MSRWMIAVASLFPLICAFGPAGARAEPQSAFAFDFVSIDGKPMPLKQFAGRALLVVNTASFCGYTRQYQGLQKLFDTYESKGLTVIGVPSNDFGGQEPKDEAEIKTFCQGAFGVTFPLTEKQVVTGDAAHPFYKWVKSRLGPSQAPGWNFHKYLIGRDGTTISSFPSQITPDSSDLVAAIERVLGDGVAGH